MWDKMETPTIVYDLDTSGGLMEKIQTLLAPPKSRDSENTGRKPEREARRSGRTTNHSTCDSCREGGDLLCCDHCPAAFHLQCCNPPLNEEKLPPGNWMCHRCNVRSKKREQKADQTNGLPERPISKYSSSPEVELDHGSGPLRLDGVLSGAGAGGPALRMTAVPQVGLLERRCSSRTNSRPGTPTSNASSAPSEEQNEAEEMEEEAAHGSDPERTTVSAPAPRLLKRPFQLLITAAMERNPTQFQLPNELTCTSTLPGSSKRRRREQLIGKIFKKPRLETDPNGLVPLPVKVCFTCTRSCRMAPLVQCDYCPLLFHLDCLDPPLTTMPTGDWMCPHHTEHLVMNPNLSNRCQLFDQFQDRMSQHAVKVDFLRWVHRRNLPNHPSIHQHKRKTIKVPDGIKSQYHSPPLMLAPPGVRGGELVCSGVPEHKHAAQHSTSQAEQQEWLQDIIALQCSIMQHSSSKQKSSPWSNWDSRVHLEKADMKSCVETEEHNTLPSSIRTASTTPCSKPSSTLNVPQGTSELKILTQGGHCTCAVRPCLNCNKKPNGPLVELLPTIDPRLVIEAAASDPSRQADLHHRLNPPKTPPAPAQTPSPGVPNHIGEVEVKTESSSPLKLCSSGDCPPSHTLCSVIGPEHPAHIKGSSQTVCGERTQTTHKTVKDFSASKLATFSPSSSVKTSPGALSSLLPSSLSSLAHLSGSWTAAIDGDGELEMSKLDVELVKLLALQRIEQLFPPKAPPTPPSSCAVPLPNTRALKPQTTHTDPQTDVQARAVFYPLMGKGLPISMCYRALYIGSGADMDVCLTHYGQCNYVSGKHACIFYDENTKHYELLNYSEHGTTVDNVLYSCDFSEKPPPSPAGSLGSKLPGVVRRCKARELEERSGGLVGLMPAGGVMSCQPQGGHRLPCSCKASSSSLIGGSGAGWEGTALLHHGSYIKLGCLQFVFSIAELANKLPKEETTNKVTATDTPNQKGADKATLSHNVPLQCTTPIP